MCTCTYSPPHKFQLSSSSNTILACPCYVIGLPKPSNKPSDIFPTFLFNQYFASLFSKLPLYKALSFTFLFASFSHPTLFFDEVRSPIHPRALKQGNSPKGEEPSLQIWLRKQEVQCSHGLRWHHPFSFHPKNHLIFRGQRPLLRRKRMPARITHSLSLPK